MSVGTSAMGRKQTRGGTFFRLDVLGEMAPVVETVLMACRVERLRARGALGSRRAVQNR